MAEGGLLKGLCSLVTIDMASCLFESLRGNII